MVFTSGWLIGAAIFLLYAIVGAWTFGYVSGLDGRGEDPHSKGYESPKYAGLGYYRNEEAAWVPAIFWPVALLFFLVIKPLAFFGYRRGCNTLRVRKTRIELQKKLRVELEKAERELEDELDSQRVTGANRAA